MDRGNIENTVNGVVRNFFGIEYMKDKINKLEKFELVEFDNNLYLQKFVSGSYKVGTNPHTYGISFYDLEGMEMFVNKLLEIVEEIKNNYMISYGDQFWFVSHDGRVKYDIWFGTDLDIHRMSLNNIFKSREEAEANKDSILSKFEDVKKKYVR